MKKAYWTGVAFSFGLIVGDFIANPINGFWVTVVLLIIMLLWSLGSWLTAGITIAMMANTILEALK